MGYCLEERETHLLFDAVTKRWKIDTRIPAHIRKFQRLNYKMSKEEREGEAIISAMFEAPENAISFRDTHKLTISDAEKQRRAAILRKNKKGRTECIE